MFFRQLKTILLLGSILSRNLAFAVGIRTRGGGSRSGEKRNLDINMDKYFKGQTYAGLSCFMLNANNQDGSLLHEALAMKLFSRFGLPAPAEAPARRYMKPECFGFYRFIEKLDEEVVDRNFGEFKRGFMVFSTTSI